MLSQIQHFHLNYVGMHIVKTPHTMNIMFNHQWSHHLRLWKIGQLKFCFEENQLTLMIIRKYPNVLFALVHHFGLLQLTWTHKDISCIRTSLVIISSFIFIEWMIERLHDDIYQYHIAKGKHNMMIDHLLGSWR